MKKLLLFLLLSVTTFVHGSEESLNKALNAIDAAAKDGMFLSYDGKKDIAPFIDSILQAAIDIFSEPSSVADEVISVGESRQLSNLVELVIRHIKNANGNLLEANAYSAIFSYLSPSKDDNSVKEYLYLNGLLEKLNVQKNKPHIIVGLRAFHASLLVNYEYLLCVLK